MPYTYILKCSDKTFYTGWTTDLDNRLKSHNDGKASKYTRGRLPVALIYFEEYSTKNECLKREIEIKKMTRNQKNKLLTKNI